MQQDARHVLLQYHLAMSGCVRRVLEVGCHRGYSSSAYVQAMRDGAALELTCCDLHITPELRELAAAAPRPVLLLECSSVVAIDDSYGLVVLDGDHTIEMVSRELGMCLYHRTPTIILHDYAAADAPNCEGPVWAGLTLQCHPEYQCVGDLRARPGEHTNRGLLVATRSGALADVARSIIKSW